MKKLLLFFSLLLSLALPAAAETKNATITFADQGWSNAEPLDGVSCSIIDPDTNDAVASVLFAQNTNKTNPPKYYGSDKTARLYDGNTVQISAADASIQITNVTSDPTTTFTQNADGTFLFTGKKSFTSITVTYDVAEITTPAEKPEVTINGVTIEDGCFYNITNGSQAEVSAKYATSITILYNNGDGLEELTGSNGTFTIATAGEYTIESVNGDHGGKELSFTVNLTEPKQVISSTDVWEKVLSTDAITDDGEYIIVCETKNEVASNENNTNNRKALAVTISDSKIKSLLAAGVEKLPLIINIKKEGESNYYLFATNYLGDTTKGNYLVSVNGDNNLLKIGAKSTTSDDAITTISFEATGDAIISFVNCKKGTNVRTIRCNSNSPLFATYGSGQTAVQIYKRGADEQTTTLEYSTAEYMELPELEQDVVAKTITYSSSTKNALFEEKHYAATATQSYTLKSAAEGWNPLENGVFDYAAFNNDIIVEARAYREDSNGTRIVESPIQAIRISAGGVVTGIESVAAEAEGEAELYNLQGVRVNRAEAAPGLYIERRAGKTAKVIL